MEEIKILFENKDLIVCVKPAGILSEESGEKASLPLLLRRAAEARGERAPRFLTVHRLDREVGGVMVLAKNPKTASILSEAIRERRAVKEYLAVVRGELPPRGEYEDLLFRDSKTMKTYVVDRVRAGVRQAKLSFTTLARGEENGKPISLAAVRLFTGRTHQIRVQFASRKTPLFGDGRYGSGDNGDRPALFSRRLMIPGLFDCRAVPEDYPFTLFEGSVFETADPIDGERGNGRNEIEKNA